MITKKLINNDNARYHVINPVIQSCNFSLSMLQGHGLQIQSLQYRLLSRAKLKKNGLHLEVTKNHGLR